MSASSSRRCKPAAGAKVHDASTLQRCADRPSEWPLLRLRFVPPQLKTRKAPEHCARRVPNYQRVRGVSNRAPVAVPRHRASTPSIDYCRTPWPPSSSRPLSVRLG
jgi:hypothetical protein